jgi:hypothetical protein
MMIPSPFPLPEVEGYREAKSVTNTGGVANLFYCFDK